MTINKEIFVDLHEKYQKVLKLLLEDSKYDPETEPYLSKYSAKQILIGMKANIENILRSQTPGTQDHLKFTAMLGSVYLYLGTVAIDTEELSLGEKHLEKCKEVICLSEDVPQMILIALNMYNQFGILWSKSDPEKSKFYLEVAEQLYKNFKNSGNIPVDIADLFEPNLATYHDNLAIINFEKLHTLTLYYLAQIFGVLKQTFKSAVYCHITLKRQLEMDDYEPIDWALNSATLSQFFMEKCGFKQARHHLAASLYILDKYKADLFSGTDQGEILDSKIEVFNHRSADVARCWVKYGIFLLNKSKERLLAHTEDIDENCKITSDLAKIELTDEAQVSIDDLQNLSFTSISVDKYENCISDQFALTIADAKRIFVNAQEWIGKAQEYYTLDTHASDYIEIVLDFTQLYLNLIFFEDNYDSQAKLHKRRIDLLETLSANINSQYYMHYSRQMWFELGRTYSDLLDIKAEKLKECNDRPKPQALNKINSLVDKSIKYYKQFIDSFKLDITNLEKIPDENEKPFLQAYFHVAALFGRYITLDKQFQLKHNEQQYAHYKYIADYCEKHLKAQELIPMELGICKDMVTLLPIKLLRLKQTVS
ncbi:KIF-binding protein-like [Cylas formicarius]|uniref:KIF-binding protein-like n=1 Tax=Cylas formicarius TaxID=197179 RepID=UPI0029585B1B|nr:KIF-binding protein-like [Cylas formicarius]